MSKQSSVKRNLAASWAAHLVALLVGVVLMPFVLHTLGDASYGTWIFINSIAGYSGLLYLGFGQTVCRYVSRYHARQEWDLLNEVVSVVLGVYLCMGTVAVAAAALLAWLAPSLHVWSGQSLVEIRLVILMLGLNVALGMIGSVFGGVLMGIQRFEIHRAVNIVAGLLRLVLTVAFLRAECGLLVLSSIFLGLTVLENGGHLLFAFRKVPTLSIKLKHFRLSALRRYLSFSAFSCLDLVAYQVIEVSDIVIIGFIYGAEATVPYYIALRLCRFITRPILQIGYVFMPRAGELHAGMEKHKLNELVIKGFGFAFLLMMGFVIGAAFFGRHLLGTWVGSGYESSYLLLLVLLGTQVVATPVEVLRSVLFGMGRVRVPALLYVLEAAANIALSLILIGPLGLMGVALGTAIPVIVIEACLLMPYAYRQLRLEPGQLIRRALAPQLLPLAALWGYSFLVQSFAPLEAEWIPLLAVSAGGGMVLAIAWLGGDWLRRNFEPQRLLQRKFS
jgi:O-antigen/teichoic acid export membrane protein